MHVCVRVSDIKKRKLFTTFEGGKDLIKTLRAKDKHYLCLENFISICAINSFVYVTTHLPTHLSVSLALYVKFCRFWQQRHKEKLGCDSLMTTSNNTDTKITSITSMNTMCCFCSGCYLTRDFLLQDDTYDATQKLYT